jgi:TonB family protein
MRQLVALSILFSCVICAAWSQPSSPAQQTKSNGPVLIAKMGPDTTAPTLMPVDFSTAISNQCERKFHGKVDISLIVDASGLAQNMLFLKPAVNDLDRLAILVAQMDRFTPAMKGGAAVAIGEQLDLLLEACVISRTDEAGRNVHSLRLASAPEQKLGAYDGYPPKVIFASERLPGNPRAIPPDQFHKVGGNISSPIPINLPQAEFSDEGRLKKISGMCVVNLFVDVYGVPHDLILEKSLEPSMDQKALEAASRYRFKPALRDKLEPVPVMISIEVNFRIPQ